MKFRNIEEDSPASSADVGGFQQLDLESVHVAFLHLSTAVQALISHFLSHFCYDHAMTTDFVPSNTKPRDFGPCPICSRPMLDDGVSTDKHHMIPKSKGGVETTRLHKVCHGFIHSQWSEKELASTLKDPAAILSTAEAQAFLSWVMKKPPGHVARSRRASRKGPRRR